MSVSLSKNNFDSTDYVLIAHGGIVSENGHSAEEMIKLRRAKELHCKIMAVDKAILYCFENGIFPDVTLLGTGKNKVGFDDLPKGPHKIMYNEDPINLTDVEFAIQRSKELYSNAKIVIYGGLGNIRIDYKIHLLFLLLKNATQMRLKSENETVFALNSAMGDVTLNVSDFKTIGFLPISGMAKNLQIGIRGSYVSYKTLENQVSLYHTNNSKSVTLRLGEGEVIVCLDRRNSCTSNFSQNILEESTLFPKELIKLIDCLFQLTVLDTFERIVTDQETIRSIGKNVALVECEKGRSISFFPFPGPVKGFETAGLMWEYENLNQDNLPKDSPSISNISKKRGGITASVQEGRVLCIYNNIDKTFVLNKLTKMVEEAKINSKVIKSQSSSPSFVSTQIHSSQSSQSVIEEISIGNPLSSRNNSGNIDKNSQTSMRRDSTNINNSDMQF